MRRAPQLCLLLSGESCPTAHACVLSSLWRIQRMRGMSSAARRRPASVPWRIDRSRNLVLTRCLTCMACLSVRLRRPAAAGRSAIPINPSSCMQRQRAHRRRQERFARASLLRPVAARVIRRPVADIMGQNRAPPQNLGFYVFRDVYFNILSVCRRVSVCCVLTSGFSGLACLGVVLRKWHDSCFGDSRTLLDQVSRVRQRYCCLLVWRH